MKLLEKVANVAVILTAVAFIGTVLYDRLSPRRPTLDLSAQTLVGKTLTLPKSLSASSTVPLTLVIFASKNCHFCSTSMPFYRRLAMSKEHSPNGFRLLGVVPAGRETSTEAARYFAQYEVPVDGTGEMNFSALGVRATPTLALLDRSSRVLAAWTGALSSNKEGEIISKIQSMCRGCVSGA